MICLYQCCNFRRDSKSSFTFQTPIADVCKVKTSGNLQAALYTSQLLVSLHVCLHSGTRYVFTAARAVNSRLNGNGYSKPRKADCVSALGTFLLSDSQKIAYHFISQAPDHNVHLFYNVLKHTDEKTRETDFVIPVHYLLR